MSWNSRGDRLEVHPRLLQQLRWRATESHHDDGLSAQIVISHHTTFPVGVVSTPHDDASCSTSARPRPVTASVP